MLSISEAELFHSQLVFSSFGELNNFKFHDIRLWPITIVRKIRS